METQAEIPMPNLSKASAGTTLIETLIAMSVLIIGLTSVFDCMITANRVNQRATNQARAYEEIQAQIETFQIVAFTDMRRSFKGYHFTVVGLIPPTGFVKTGSVTRADRLFTTANASVTTNEFGITETKMPIRFRVDWIDDQGPAFVEVAYVFTDRNS
jgi:Tfp pilus assembly protein PilV